MSNKNWMVISWAPVFLFCYVVQTGTAVVSPQSRLDTIPYHPLEREEDLDVLINEVGEARVVLLGESTHGTHEYYNWRAAITKRLIAEKGFDLMAIEGDWTDSYKINQFIKGSSGDTSSVIEALKQYDRWPSSMWSNYEMVPLLQWLVAFNQSKGGTEKIGFYGLDVYSFWEWTQNKTDIQDSAIQRMVREVKDFFAAYNNDAMKYADSLRHSTRNGSGMTQHLWNAVQKFTQNKEPSEEKEFMLYQQALLTLQGERYFRTLISDHVKAVNIRDAYMAETIKNILDFYGRGSKIVVWMHNGHTGDAHYSDMSSSGYTSVAEILNNQLGRNKIFSVGFGTYKGTVMAGSSWNAPVQKQIVLPAKSGSWEYLLHKQSSENKIIISREVRNNPGLNKWMEFRSIGAAYDGAAIYGLSIIPRRFDSFIFIDSTTASHPIKK